MQRLPFNATTEQEVIQYFTTRALQLASSGFVWSRYVSSAIPGSYTTYFVCQRTGARTAVHYILNQFRGRGIMNQLIQTNPTPIITIRACNVEGYLQTKAPGNHSVVDGPYDTTAYHHVENYYGDQRAKRSGVYLMNHIDEGLVILDAINASTSAQRAYCIHPMLQDDQPLVENINKLIESETQMVIALALEYRNQANKWLSDKVWLNDDSLVPYLDQHGLPNPGPLSDVRDMLIADKVQNYKDFILYHRGTHARWIELEHYFHEWLKALGISQPAFDEMYKRLCNIANTPIKPYTVWK